MTSRSKSARFISLIFGSDYRLKSLCECDMWCSEVHRQCRATGFNLPLRMSPLPKPHPAHAFLGRVHSKAAVALLQPSHESSFDALRRGPVRQRTSIFDFPNSPSHVHSQLYRSLDDRPLPPPGDRASGVGLSLVTPPMTNNIRIWIRQESAAKRREKLGPCWTNPWQTNITIWLGTTLQGRRMQIVILISGCPRCQAQIIWG